MSTVLEMKRWSRKASSQTASTNGPCEIVIFPGVRIERHDIDLGHRVRKTIDNDDYDGMGGSSRRRKSS